LSQANLLLGAAGIILIGLGGLIGFAAEFFLTLRQLALFRLYAGFADDFGSAYQFVARKKFQLLATIIGTYILFLFLIVFWSAEIGLSLAFSVNKNFAIGGLIAASFGAFFILFSMIASAVPLVLIAPSLALESDDFSRILASAFRLLLKHLLRIFGFVLLVAIVLSLLSMVLNIPPALLSIGELAFKYFKNQAMAKTPNLPIQIFASGWRSCANMILSPVAFLSIGFFYLDLRMRSQGFDIRQRIERLRAPLKSPLSNP
jgi:hypothetical protein